jgi:dihydroflavonol-4-reductase
LAERVLVTGATGFIGSHLVGELTSSGARITCLTRASSDTSAIEIFSPSYVVGDILKPDSLLEATLDVDFVFHLAAAQESFNPQEYYDLNVTGTRNLLEACSRRSEPPVFIYVSSISAAGPSATGEPLSEEDPPAPISHYGKSKLAAEEVVRSWSNTIPATIVRPPLVFGERDRYVFQMFQWVNFGLHPIPPKRGSRFSLIHASDLSMGMIEAARDGERLDTEDPERPGKGIYYFAYDQHPTYLELGELIAAALKRRNVRMIHIPPPLTWLIAFLYEVGARVRGSPGIVSFDKAREGLGGSLVCSPRKAADQLGFKPEKSVEDRMRQTAQWYQDNGWL